MNLIRIHLRFHNFRKIDLQCLSKNLLVCHCSICSYQKTFNQYSKNTIRNLLQDYDNKKLFIKIRQELPFREKTQLQKLLSEL